MVSRSDLRPVHKHLSDAVIALSAVRPTSEAGFADVVALADLLTEAQARLARISRDLPVTPSAHYPLPA
jgi:hypothetical protein